MPILPTLFDDYFAYELDNLLIKTAQGVEELTPGERSDLLRKLVNQLASQQLVSNAPKLEDLADTNSFIQYLKNNKITDDNNVPIVSDTLQGAGAVKLDDHTFIYPPGVNKLLQKYKQEAESQKNIQALYFSQALDNLTAKLKTTPGLEEVGTEVPEQAANKTTTQETSSGQPVNPQTSTTQPAPQNQQSQQQAFDQQPNSQTNQSTTQLNNNINAIKQQFTAQDFPLPINGVGEFNVGDIQNSIDKIFQVITSQQSLYNEFKNRIPTLQQYQRAIHSNVEAFLQTTPDHQADLMVSQDQEELVNEFRLMFNPTQGGANLDSQDMFRYGVARSAKAAGYCAAIATWTDSFLSTLLQTSFSVEWANELQAQINAAQALAIKFHNTQSQLISQIPRPPNGY